MEGLTFSPGTDSWLRICGPDHARDLKVLRSEAGETRRQISRIGRAAAHTTLVKYGLLPNYALTETRTTLEPRSPGRRRRRPEANAVDR